MYDYRNDKKYLELLKYMDDESGPIQKKKNTLEFLNVISQQHFQITNDGVILQIPPSRVTRKEIGQVSPVETRTQKEWHEAFNLISKKCHFELFNHSSYKDIELETSKFVIKSLFNDFTVLRADITSFQNFLNNIDLGYTHNKLKEFSTFEQLIAYLLRYGFVNNSGKLISSKFKV